MSIVWHRQTAFTAENYVRLGECIAKYKPKRFIFATFREGFEQILDIIVYGESSSSDSSSSDEDDMEILLLEMAFAPKLQLPPRIHLEDISEIDCENMFR